MIITKLIFDNKYSMYIKQRSIRWCTNLQISIVNNEPSYFIITYKVML